MAKSKQKSFSEFDNFMVEIRRAWEKDKDGRTIEEEAHISKLALTIKNGGVPYAEIARRLGVNEKTISNFVTKFLKDNPECGFDRDFSYDLGDLQAEQTIENKKPKDPDEHAVVGAIREMNIEGLKWIAQHSNDQLQFFLNTGILMHQNYTIESENSENKAAVFVQFIRDKTRAGEKLVVAEEKVKDLVETIKHFQHLIRLRNRKIEGMEEENIYLAAQCREMTDNYDKVVARVEAMEQGFVMGEQNALSKQLEEQKEGATA